MDAGTDECLDCLATKCCSDAAACFEESACTGQWGTYQSCVHDPKTVDPSGCYSDFTRAGAGDAASGAGPHEALYKCIAFFCKACGAPGVL